MKFKDKVAIVTGSGQGLGRGIALAFAKEGAKVVVTARTESRIEEVVSEIEALGAEVLGVTVDISSSSSVREMFARVLERFGTVDILINNAARTPDGPKSTKARIGFLELMTTPVPKRSLEVTRNMSDEEWEEMMATNLNGMFYCTREALRIMEDKHYGKIVNIASTAGVSGLSFHSPHYSASKGGVVAFTRSVGLEVIGTGVNVNCIAAGGIATDAWNNFPAEIGKMVMQMIPAGRLGTIEEYASMALYLASDDAAYIVGQIISPNGGLVT